MRPVVVRSIDRAEARVIETLGRLGVATELDALGQEASSPATRSRRGGSRRVSWRAAPAANRGRG